MTSFHTIAVPHKDILDGKLTLDVFAADLWEVNQERGPDEYKDAETFCQKTYVTQGEEWGRCKVLRFLWARHGATSSGSA